MKKVFDFIKNRIIKATQGVISIFLALLLVPFTSIACGLVSAARINSAVAIFDEALCNASNSTLGTYDEFLKNRFGLLATNQDYTTDDFINELFKKYLEVNLGSLSNTYITFESQTNGVFSLADTNILKAQILEFSKYTVPTQVAIDGLGIDGLISSLEDALGFGSIFSTTSKALDTGSAIVQLGTDYDALKTTVENYETANGSYGSAASEFISSVNTFVDEVSAKKTTMNQKKSALDAAEKKLDNPQISVLNDEIEELKIKIEDEKEAENPDTELITKWEESLKAKEEELKELNDANAAANKAYKKALKEYNSAKSAYDEAVKKNKEKVNTEKSEYSTAIANVISWLKEYKSDMKAVQDDLVEVADSAANTTVAIVKEVKDNSLKQHESDTEANKNKIKELNKQIAETDDKNKKEELTKEIEYLKYKNDLAEKEKVSAEHAQKVTEKGNTTIQDSIDDVKEKITKASQDDFDAKIAELEALKVKIDNFNVEKISAKISSSDYYCDLDGAFPNHNEIVEAETAFVGNIVKDSALNLLKTILSFVDALLSLTLFYVPELNAVIDEDYYKAKKEDVPETGFDINQDAQLSQQYKDLFGDYSANDMDALAAYDVVTSIKTIFDQFGVISSKFSGLNIISSILNLGQTISDIKTAFTTIKNEISSLFTFLSNLIAGSGVYQKFLVTGYATYMTSNRTTYDEKSPLNHASYNLKKTEGLGDGTLAEALSRVEKPTSLLNALNFSDIGKNSKGSDKCFKGAETEYLLIGNKSERVNQFTTFWIIYATRIVLNMPAVFTNAEIASIAAATTICSPVVYIIVLLLEALADTLLLVNGTDVPLVKFRTVYVSPTGIGKFIEKITDMKLSSARLDEIKSSMESEYKSKEMSDEKIETDSSSSDTGSDGKTKGEPEILSFDYTKYMFVSMLFFTSEEKLLNRLSDIIQMECIEKQINDGTADPKFNINRSYTYIRTSASFTTNEFIKLSTSDGLFSTKERILYKGY